MTTPKSLKEKGRIEKGDKIEVDKGILGKDTGVFISVDGFSAFGYFGRYRSDKDNKEHIYDEFVNSIKKLCLT